MKRKFKTLRNRLVITITSGLLGAQFLSFWLLLSDYAARQDNRIASIAAFRLADQRGGPSQIAKSRSTFSTVPPKQKGKKRLVNIESELREIFATIGVSPDKVVVLSSHVDTVATPKTGSSRHQASREILAYRGRVKIYDVGIRLKRDSHWQVVHIVARPEAYNRDIVILLFQMIFVVVVLLCGLVVNIKRITDPLNALAIRNKKLPKTRDPSNQLVPRGADDIRRLTEANYALQNRILVLLSQKSLVLRAVGHRLRPKLQTLSSQIQALPKTADEDQMLETVVGVSRMLDDILLYSEVIESKPALERARLSGLLKSIVACYIESGEPVTLDIRDDVEVWISTEWVTRAIRNLISNALRYGHTARVVLYLEKSAVVVSVDDDGYGLAADDIGRMTQAFIRGESSRNRGTGGAGLGLTLVEAIIERHGGRIVVANRLDRAGKQIGLSAKIVFRVNAHQM